MTAHEMSKGGSASSVRAAVVPGDVAARYIAAFAGRTDVYGVNTTDGWRPRRSPLTPAVVVEAFATDSPITFYFLPPGEMTHVAAVDFDADDGFEQATRMAYGMWDDGVPAYLEASRRGAHLWVVTEDRVHARILGSALRAYLQAVGLPPEDPKIELRPGDRLPDSPGAIGLSLRAPMMAHPLTGAAAVLLDPRTGQPLGDTVAAVMKALRRASSEKMAAAAERYRPPTPTPALRYPLRTPRFPARSARFPITGRKSRIETFNSENTVSRVLAREFGHTRAAPGRSVRCPGPAHRSGDRSPSLSVLPDDRRAYCHLSDCVFHGNGHGVDAFDIYRIATGELR